MNKPVYSLLESSLFKGGIKVKRDGSTAAQFPTLDSAIKYLKTILKKEAEYYQEIEFVKASGAVEIINLFEE